VSFIVDAAAAALLAASEVAAGDFRCACTQQLCCTFRLASLSDEFLTSHRPQRNFVYFVQPEQAMKREEGKGPAKPSQGKQPCQSTPSGSSQCRASTVLYSTSGRQQYCTVRREGTAMWCSRCLRCSGPWRCVCSGFICWPWPRTRAGLKDAFLGAGSCFEPPLLHRRSAPQTAKVK
jgi:hypothetical protein